MSGSHTFDGNGRRPPPQIMFSLIDGCVWASWLGSPATVRLGEYDEVTAMMRDFLAHGDLAARLSDPKWADSGSQRGDKL